MQTEGKSWTVESRCDQETYFTQTATLTESAICQNLLDFK